MSNKIKTVLVVGASGMLGNTVMRLFASSPEYKVWGSARSNNFLMHMPKELHNRVVTDIDVDNSDSLLRLFELARPDVVINCIGLVKQLSAAEDPLSAIPINSMLPHRLARICNLIGARFVHVSTDCVFSGSKGNYCEGDPPDAGDLYGRSKLLGEVDCPHAVTLRTSIIGHELSGAKSLISWFLSQEGEINGFTNAVFSGLPTVELARVIRDFVLPCEDLHGLYHVSSRPISKFELLSLVADIYGKSLKIRPVDLPVIDRSLDSMRFRSKTGYNPADWPSLIRLMHQFK